MVRCVLIKKMTDLFICSLEMAPYATCLSYISLPTTSYRKTFIAFMLNY